MTGTGRGPRRYHGGRPAKESDMAKRGRGGEFFSELMVGVFMVAVLALLAYFTIIVAGVDIMNGTQTRHQRIAQR